mgnify:CR=1 FL=1
MEPTSLSPICAIAFTAVFAILAFLALAIHVITQLFPAREQPIDPALVVAIGGAVGAVLRGAKLTRIEEER